MNGSIHKLLLYYRPHNIGLRLRHKSLFLTYVLAPLCAISNFNYEQVNPRNFPAAMLLHGKLSFRKPVLRSPSSGFFVHRAFPIQTLQTRNNNKAVPVSVRPMSLLTLAAILTVESVQFGSDKMDKYLDKWTCRRTSSLQHVTYPADKW